MSDSDNPTPAVPDVVPTQIQRAVAFDWVLKKIREHWTGYKPPDDGRDCINEVYGSMHVLVSHAEGYERYIVAHKCDDKQGEIARQSVEIKQLHAENARLRDALNEVCNINEAALRELDSRDYASRLNQLDVVRSILDENIPVCPLNEDAEWSLEQCRQAEAERDRYRSIVENVVRWAAIIAAGEGNPTWCVVARVFTVDRDAARELCREFGVDADGGEMT